MIILLAEAMSWPDACVAIAGFIALGAIGWAFCKYGING